MVSSLPDSGSDYWKSDTMFDLKYCNWNKDMLMGVLPNSQFGDVAVIDVSNTEGAISSSIFLKSPNSAASSQVVTAGSYNAPLTPVSFSAKDASTSNVIPAGSTLQVDLSNLQSQFTVLAFRQAEALQRWKEISQSGYRDWETDRKSTRLNSSHRSLSRMPSSA